MEGRQQGRRDAAPRIVLVDDDRQVCSILAAGLHREGFDCRQAFDGDQALALLAEADADVVITDIKMPGMDGIELCRRVRADFGADVMVMTGFATDYNYEQIVAEGASDFVQKPVRLAELSARVRRILAERRSRRERRQALDELRDQVDRFRRAMEGIVQAIAVAVEIRDPYTAGHQQRVAELACAMAEQMGWPADEIFGLRMAAVIHDLGKITVPAEILAKPGKLSDLEYELIKSHVQAGYDILKEIDFPWPLAEVVYQHHERLDGSGYPRGLRAEAIVPAARILAVADVFETIASHRPYRPSLGIQRAVDELNQHSGRLYDSACVDACLHLVQNKGFGFQRRAAG